VGFKRLDELFFSCHMGESFDLSFEYGDLVSVQMHVLVNFRSLIYRCLYPTLYTQYALKKENPSSLRSTSYRKIYLLGFFCPGCGIAPFFSGLLSNRTSKLLLSSRVWFEATESV